MNNIAFALSGAWQVLLAGLILGAGLPAVFALGVRSLAYGTGGSAEVDNAAPHPIGKLLAGVFFLIVILAVVLGITIIVASGFGMKVSFDHVIPMLVKK